MGVSTNSNPRNSPAPASPLSTTTPRAPRRLVLLAGEEQSDVAQVLNEYQGAEVKGSRIHQDLQRLALVHKGRWIAAEWLGPLGWTRYLWCRK